MIRGRLWSSSTKSGQEVLSLSPPLWMAVQTTLRISWGPRIWLSSTSLGFCPTEGSPQFLPLPLNKGKCLFFPEMSSKPFHGQQFQINISSWWGRCGHHAADTREDRRG